MNKEKPKSLKGRLLFFIVLCWLVPLLVLFVFVAFSYRNEVLGKSELILDKGIENMVSTLSMRVDEAISISKKPSYEGFCEGVWKKYRIGMINETQFSQQINSVLKTRFYIDKKFNLFTFYYEGKEEPLCYSANSNYTFQSYMDEIHDEMKTLISSDSSDAHLKVVNGKIFIVRNMYTITNYKKFGTLIVELNQDKLFQGINVDMSIETAVRFNEEEELVFQEREVDKKIEEYFKTLFQEHKGKDSDTMKMNLDGRYKGYIQEKDCRDYDIGAALLVSSDNFYASLFNLYKVIALIILILIPVLLYGVRFLNKQISEPVQRMVKATKAIEDGQLGTVVEESTMPNAEFNYLLNSFNHMSAQIKYLFDYAYDEKMAGKDAKIIALQAQINPHFLNNTLEMMNWQARMSKDVTISKMIEALGTVLDYRMDRTNNPLINLAEELRCADAYFYIISMRFGKRLKVERNVDEALLQIKVPRLILQPILENAVVHGIEQVNSGIIEISIYHDDSRIYMKVQNSGKPMTKEDLERIEWILSGKPGSIGMEPGSHTSLGIRNVNERIKLIYGKDYGLTISPAKENKTLSVITLPYEDGIKKNEENERQKAQKQLRSTGKIGE